MGSRHSLSAFFNQDAELIAAGIPAIRLYFFGFFMMSLNSPDSRFSSVWANQKSDLFLYFPKSNHRRSADNPAARYVRNGHQLGVFAAEPISTLSAELPALERCFLPSGGN